MPEFIIRGVAITPPEHDGQNYCCDMLVDEGGYHHHFEGEGKTPNDATKDMLTGVLIMAPTLFAAILKSGEPDNGAEIH